MKRKDMIYKIADVLTKVPRETISWVVFAEAALKCVEDAGMLPPPVHIRQDYGDWLLNDQKSEYSNEWEPESEE